MSFGDFSKALQKEHPIPVGNIPPESYNFGSGIFDRGMRMQLSYAKFRGHTADPNVVDNYYKNQPNQQLSQTPESKPAVKPQTAQLDTPFPTAPTIR